MALLAVWLERGPKGMAIDDAFHCRHTPRGKLRTGVLWQDKKGPRAFPRRFCWSQEFCLETDIRCGFGHWCNRSNESIRSLAPYIQDEEVRTAGHILQCGRAPRQKSSSTLRRHLSVMRFLLEFSELRKFYLLYRKLVAEMYPRELFI